MSEHYFSSRPEALSDPMQFTYTLRGNTLRFTTDHGVFSKKEVDFGSKILIETFLMPDVEGDVLDLGCGYGPVGISLAKEYEDRKFLMVDVNERALGLSKTNAEQNHVSNVSIFKSDLFENIPSSQKFAAILTNPPIRAGKKVVHQILEQAITYLLPEGELWVVIQKKQGAPSALEKLHSIYENVEIVEKKKGYWIIKSSCNT